MELFLTPNGRIDQPTYWRAVLILFAASAVISILSVYVNGIFGLLTLGVIWAWIAVHAKRFHDNGKSGWYMLLLILVAAILNLVLGGILPSLFGFDQAAYNEEMTQAMSDGGFASVVEVLNTGQRATMIPGILGTLIVTGILGAIMSLFKTDPNDNQYGPGPGGAGAGVSFN